MFTPEEVAILKKRTEASRHNLVDLRYYFLTNGKDEVTAPLYHEDWSNILLNEKDNFAIEGFRESGKGQIVIRAYPLHCLMFPSIDRDYIVLIKQNATLAGNKLIEIEEEYLSNPALSSNLVKVNQKSSEVFSVDVKNAFGEVINVRIEVYGKGSSIRGLANKDRRPRICLLDDPQDSEDAKSDTILDNDWKWFMSDVMFLGKDTRIFLIGNNLGEKCIIERVFGNVEGLGFKKRKVAILNDEGESNWPHMFSVERVEKEKEGYRRSGELDIWMRERMCEATSAETRLFDMKDFPRYSYLYVDNIIHDANISATLDPASSKNPGSCLRAIVVKAITEDNRWIIVDIPYGRWNSVELIDKMFEVVVRWQPYLKRRRFPFGIEKGMIEQTLGPFLHQEMQRRNIIFDLVPLEHAAEGSKFERVKMLAPRAKIHSIWLPEIAPWLTELENELTGVTKYGFKSMFKDLIDALAMHEQMNQRPIVGNKTNRLVAEIEQVPAEAYNPLTMKSDRQLAGTYDPTRL